MNVFLLYALLLKATLTTFNGPSSLPVLRHELVVHRKVLSDRDLNAAVTYAQSSPGPMGMYVVSVGYFVAGVPGAIAGWFALVTPAFLVIPLIRYAGNRVEHPRVRSALQAAVLASTGLILAATRPLAREALTGWIQIAVAIGAFALLASGRVPTIGIIAGAAIIGLIVA